MKTVVLRAGQVIARCVNLLLFWDNFHSGSPSVARRVREVSTNSMPGLLHAPHLALRAVLSRFAVEESNLIVRSCAIALPPRPLVGRKKMRDAKPLLARRCRDAATPRQICQDRWAGKIESCRMRRGSWILWFWRAASVSKIPEATSKPLPRRTISYFDCVSRLSRELRSRAPGWGRALCIKTIISVRS